MSWETRRGRRYYYSARREGGKVVKTYAPPLIADLAAAVDAVARQRRADAAAAHRAERERIAALAAAIAPLDELADALAAAALLAAGFHRHHRGEWRKTTRTD